VSHQHPAMYFLTLMSIQYCCNYKNYNFQITKTWNTQLIGKLTWQPGHPHWKGFLEQLFLLGCRQPW
jgi:hypothetical protein